MLNPTGSGLRKVIARHRNGCHIRMIMECGHSVIRDPSRSKVRSVRCAECFEILAEVGRIMAEKTERDIAAGRYAD